MSTYFSINLQGKKRKTSARYITRNLASNSTNKSSPFELIMHLKVGTRQGKILLLQLVCYRLTVTALEVVKHGSGLQEHHASTMVPPPWVSRDSPVLVSH